MIIKKHNKYELIKKPKILYGLKCILCNRPATEEHHCISGRAGRKQSEKYGLTIPLCHQCHWELHNHNKNYYEVKQIAQEVFEKEHSREEWMSIFHKNYL